MAIVLDTGIVYAYYDRRDAWQRESVALIKEAAGRLILPAPVIPEVDHLLGARLGRRARMTFYRGLVGGSYLVQALARDRYQRVVALNEEFEELDLGFVDASIVAIAESLGVRRIATTDRRHFGALQKPLRLELLPHR